MSLAKSLLSPGEGDRGRTAWESLWTFLGGGRLLEGVAAIGDLNDRSGISFRGVEGDAGFFFFVGVVIWVACRDGVMSARVGEDMGGAGTEVLLIGRMTCSGADGGC